MMDTILTITLTPEGLQVGGPIANKLLCLGMLEAAKPVILNYNPTAIQVAPANSIQT